MRAGIRPTWVLAALFGLITSAAMATDAATAPSGGQTRWADLDFEAASGEPARIKAAIDGYQAAAQPEDGEWLWRVSKAWFHLYDELPKSEKKLRVHAAEQAESFGERAVFHAPGGVESRYWYTQGMLAVADMKGAASFLRRIRKIRQLIAAVREDNPAIDDGGPDRFQAIVLMESPWPFRDLVAARGYAEAAYAISADRCANIFVLAATQAQTGQAAAARPLYDRLRSGQCRASSPYWLDLYRTVYADKLQKSLE